MEEELVSSSSRDTGLVHSNFAKSDGLIWKDSSAVGLEELEEETTVTFGGSGNPVLTTAAFLGFLIGGQTIADSVFFSTIRSESNMTY